MISILSIFSAYLVNNFIFDPQYFPDQNEYKNAYLYIRSKYFLDTIYTLKQYLVPYITGLLPFPTDHSFEMLGLYNRFILISFFIFLRAKRILSTNLFILLIFYPSLMIYSSLVLREVMIIVFTVSSLLLINDKKIIYSIPFIFLLYLIKYQLSLSIIIYILCMYSLPFFEKKIFYKKTFIFLTAIISSYIVYILFDTRLNQDLMGMYYENFNTPIPDDFLINNYFSFLIITIKGFFSFFLKPFTFNGSLIELLASLENIIIVLITLNFLFLSLKNIYKSLPILFFLMSSYIAHGIVTFNDGAVTRYKLPIILGFLILSSYNLNKSEIK